MKLLQNLRKDKKGFTLIEVVIVLAIAALILVIVFLAVQGAQKSQRDNAAKQGASRAIAAAQNFLSDNNGTVATFTAPASGCDLDGVTACGDFGKYFTGVVGHAGLKFRYGTVTPVNASSSPQVSFGQTCSTTGAMTSTGSTTSIAVVYWSESANKSVCINS